jgi:hypothetical protein
MVFMASVEGALRGFTERERGVIVGTPVWVCVVRRGHPAPSVSRRDPRRDLGPSVPRRPERKESACIDGTLFHDLRCSTR